ncbi:hypothetical protein MCHI_002945 [Candidatus Magnetoovum chiemensis]|nr:hypothetical protein MCHI_002945 [Candidatus Magnetoovum chiemensis]
MRKVFLLLSSGCSRLDKGLNFLLQSYIIPFYSTYVRVGLVIDKSKGKKEIKTFDEQLRKQLSAKIKQQIPLNIDHNFSNEELLLQAVDLFCWGVFRKYEKDDTEWFDIFSNRIKYDEVLREMCV